MIDFHQEGSPNGLVWKNSQQSLKYFMQQNDKYTKNVFMWL